MKNLLFLMFLFLCLSACTQEDEPNLEFIALEVAIVESNRDIVSMITHSDAFDILEATYDNDYIDIIVRYPGGCGTHSFQAVWAGLTMVPADPSSPNLFNIGIAHQVQEENCNSLITQKLRINIKESLELDRIVNSFTVPYITNGSSEEMLLANIKECALEGTVIINDQGRIKIDLDGRFGSIPIYLDDVEFNNSTNFTFKHLQKVNLSVGLHPDEVTGDSMFPACLVCFDSSINKITCIRERK